MVAIWYTVRHVSTNTARDVFKPGCVTARVYVEAEERGLREQLETLMREETWQPMEDAQQTRVLRSASAIFAVIKKSLQRCSKYVSRGEALLQLLGAFQVGHTIRV